MGAAGRPAVPALLRVRAVRAQRHHGRLFKDERPPAGDTRAGRGAGSPPRARQRNKSPPVIKRGPSPGRPCARPAAGVSAVPRRPRPGSSASRPAAGAGPGRPTGPAPPASPSAGSRGVRKGMRKEAAWRESRSPRSPRGDRNRCSVLFSEKITHQACRQQNRLRDFEKVKKE